MTPLEPLYTLKQAVEIIPYPGSVDAFRAWLDRRATLYQRRFQKRYRKNGQHSRVRLLTLTEIRRIRGELVKEIPLPTR